MSLNLSETPGCQQFSEVHHHILEDQFRNYRKLVNLVLPKGDWCTHTTFGCMNASCPGPPGKHLARTSDFSHSSFHVTTLLLWVVATAAASIPDWLTTLIGWCLLITVTVDARINTNVRKQIFCTLWLVIMTDTKTHFCSIYSKCRKMVN